MNYYSPDAHRRLNSSVKAMMLSGIFVSVMAPAHAGDDDDGMKAMVCSLTEELCDDTLPGGKLNPANPLCKKLRDICWSSKGATLDDEAMMELFLEVQKYAAEIEKQEGRT